MGAAPGLSSTARAGYIHRLLMALSVFALVVGGLGVAGAAVGPGGEVVKYRALLSGSAEVPPVETNARGSAAFRRAVDGMELRYRVQVGNIEGVTQAHLHYGAADANGPVVAFLFGPSDPIAVDKGQLAQGVIRVDDLLGGFAGDWGAFIRALDAGLIYVNVHTTANPPGELPGQVRRVWDVTDGTTTYAKPTTTTEPPTTTTTEPGQTVVVDVLDNVFQPSTVTVNVGDTVSFSKMTAGNHNVNFVDATIPDSGPPTTDTFTYNVTFTSAGTFDYFCDIHSGIGMTGTIIVNG